MVRNRDLLELAMVVNIVAGMEAMKATGASSVTALGQTLNRGGRESVIMLCGGGIAPGAVALPLASKQDFSPEAGLPPSCPLCWRKKCSSLKEGETRRERREREGECDVLLRAPQPTTQ